MSLRLSLLLAVTVLAAATGLSAQDTDDEVVAAPAPLRVLVMDPLSAPLSCPCVAGYAQRKYEKLAEHLQRILERPVHLAFNAAMVKGLKDPRFDGRVDLVIGKDSVVRWDARGQKLKIRPVAHLSGKDGVTHQTGLIVVLSDDPADSVADLADYRLFFGPADSDEKHRAAVALLEKHGVAVPAPEARETRPSCSGGAGTLLDLGPGCKAAAVVSSYAQPLLEGCGTVPEGALKVVGVTEKVPFITAFVTEHVDANAEKAIGEALLAVGGNPFLMLALETKKGFVPATKAQKKTPDTNPVKKDPAKRRAPRR